MINNENHSPLKPLLIGTFSDPVSELTIFLRRRGKQNIFFRSYVSFFESRTISLLKNQRSLIALSAVHCDQYLQEFMYSPTVFYSLIKTIFGHV